VPSVGNVEKQTADGAVKAQRDKERQQLYRIREM